MQLGMHGMPAGAGRKPGKVPKEKQTSKRAVPSDDNRLPLDTTSQSIIQGNCNPNITLSPLPQNFIVRPPTQYGDSHLSSFVSPSALPQNLAIHTVQWQSSKQFCITKWMATNK